GKVVSPLNINAAFERALNANSPPPPPNGQTVAGPVLAGLLPPEYYEDEGGFICFDEKQGKHSITTRLWEAKITERPYLYREERGKARGVRLVAVTGNDSTMVDIPPNALADPTGREAYVLLEKGDFMVNSNSTARVRDVLTTFRAKLKHE